MADFGDLAKLYSDCGSAEDGGDLGPFKPGSMMKRTCGSHYTSPLHAHCSTAHARQCPLIHLVIVAMIAFEDAVAALKIGEISGIVETDSGVHIILRTSV